MKKLLTFALFLSVGIANAQAYSGNGDSKFQVGLNAQSGATGIVISSDYGYGQNISFGLSANYLLSVPEVLGIKPEFGDRIDVKARFNANLGNVFKLDPKMDIYPGLNLGVKNFGAHLGFRYFFTDGFGLFTEAGIPIASYEDADKKLFGKLNNQFAVNFGASFNF